MSDTLTRLHRTANLRRSGRSYAAHMAAWAAYHAYADAVAAHLPFSWRSVAMDNPTQNHTGVTNGANHIVLTENYATGRLVRRAEQALCGGDTVNLWNPANSGPTCKRCIELAERLAVKKEDE